MENTNFIGGVPKTNELNSFSGTDNTNHFFGIFSKKTDEEKALKEALKYKTACGLPPSVVGDRSTFETQELYDKAISKYTTDNANYLACVKKEKDANREKNIETAKEGASVLSGLISVLKGDKAVEGSYEYETSVEKDKTKKIAIISVVVIVVIIVSYFVYVKSKKKG